ncbi:hypothetical protein [Leisingera thetidis]|uniref:hypothetical protein n=1 Tax=Leisingera thetidis TaxID=2930199 RepID=UPI0021F7989D|nr:hypothetical protein [Leisingera thetidis]
MKGWSIFVHSVGMVTRNIRWAVRIALVPVLVGFGLIYAVLSSAGMSIAVLADEDAVREAMLSGTLGTSFFLATLILLVVELWVFVSWHRFILLEEYPEGWFPRFRGGRILSYLGHGLLMGLLAVLLMIPMFAVFFALAMAAGETGSGLSMLFAFGYIIFLLIAMYRFSPILPAAAIGKPLKIKEAWQATTGSGGTIILVMVLLGAMQFALQIVTGLSIAVFAPLGFAFAGLTMLVMTLVNVSVLTTFYGHYVEGRPV